MKLKIVAISDLHGNLPVITEPADIMLLAGDIVPLNIQFNKYECKKWLEGEFAEWIKALPVEDVFMVAGNHDAYFEGLNKTNMGLFRQACNFKLKYLQNDTLIYYTNDGDPVKIFGTPYCHRYGNWPFMRDEEYMEKKFQEIPEDVDIIISHDPPYGVGQVDCILQDCRRSTDGDPHKGNIPLANRIKDLSFRLLVCGHIHSGDHSLVNNCVNVSHIDEYMVPYDNIFYTELEIKR